MQICRCGSLFLLKITVCVLFVLKLSKTTNNMVESVRREQTTYETMKKTVEGLNGTGDASGS